MLSLTATELPRFMTCNGVVSMGGVKPFDQDYTITKEGVAVHWLVEQMFNQENYNPEVFIDQKAPNGIFITPEMVEHIEEYVTDLRIVKTADNYSKVEFDTSFNATSKSKIRGRADSIIRLGTTLIILDLKYGWKIVEPKENWTLLAHAIGYCKQQYIKPEIIEFKIYQPRPYHPEGVVRKWVITIEQLEEYCNILIKTLNNPKKIVQTSEHCYRCESLSQCPAAQIASMNAVDVAETAFNNTIDNDDLSWNIKQLKRSQEILKQSLNAYEDLALHRLKEGQSISDFSIIASFGKTKWNDDLKSDFIKTLTNVDISKKTLVTPAQAKKLGLTEDVIKAFTYRPSNGFKLVEINENKKAEQLFKPKGN